MKQLIIIIMLAFATNVKAETVTVLGALKYVVVGYDDGAIAVVMRSSLRGEEVSEENPAGCTNSGTYFFPKHSSGAEEQVIQLLSDAFGRSGINVALSVSTDTCHTAQASDIADGTTYPLIQRVIRIR